MFDETESRLQVVDGGCRGRSLGTNKSKSLVVSRVRARDQPVVEVAFLATHWSVGQEDYQ